MQDKLKPCCLCGSDNVEIGMGRDFTAKCLGCYQLKVQCCQSKEEAIEKWNRVVSYLLNDNLMNDMAFIKRWVQRVYDKETSLEEFYGVLRYYTPLKPVEAALLLAGGESE